MVAAYFRYHSSYMKLFMNKRPKIKGEDAVSPTTISSEYNSAFYEPIDEINPLLQQKKCFYITQQRDRYRERPHSRGVPNVSQYRTQHLQRCLLKHFGLAVNIVTLKGTASLSCSSEVTIKEMST